MEDVAPDFEELKQLLEWYEANESKMSPELRPLTVHSEEDITADGFLEAIINHLRKLRAMSG